jgi:hypothetical protein
MTDVIAIVVSREKEAESLIVAAREKAIQIAQSTQKEIQQLTNAFAAEQKEADLRQKTDTGAIAARIKASQSEGTELRCQSIERTAEKQWTKVKETMLKEIV